MSEYIAVNLRDFVRKRGNGHCEYCRIPESFSPQPFCFEHILPKIIGGPTTEDNLALSCQGCNSFKAARTEFEDEITQLKVKLFNPRNSRWQDHFTWNEDFTAVIGISAEGRVTVKCLRLNRLGLRNLRRVLYENGSHPPIEFNQ